MDKFVGIINCDSLPNEDLVSVTIIICVTIVILISLLALILFIKYRARQNYETSMEREKLCNEVVKMVMKHELEAKTREENKNLKEKGNNTAVNETKGTFDTTSVNSKIRQIKDILSDSKKDKPSVKQDVESIVIILDEINSEINKNN